MIARLCLLLALFIAQPANAGCFLFVFCSHHARHHYFHRHHRHARIVHKTIVKTITIVREPKAQGPVVDRTPITPLK